MKKRYDYQATLHPVDETPIGRLGDGWEFCGAFLRDNDDGVAVFRLATWRRARNGGAS